MSHLSVKSVKQTFCINCISSANVGIHHMVFFFFFLNSLIHELQWERSILLCFISSGDKIRPLNFRANQSPFTADSFHFAFFPPCRLHHRWFYVTFTVGWLLKWDLAFHFPERCYDNDWRSCAGVFCRMLLWLAGWVFFSSDISVFEKLSLYFTLKPSRRPDSEVLGFFFCLFLSAPLWLEELSRSLRQPSGQQNSFSVLSVDLLTAPLFFLILLNWDSSLGAVRQSCSSLTHTGTAVSSSARRLPCLPLMTDSPQLCDIIQD